MSILSIALHLSCIVSVYRFMPLRVFFHSSKILGRVVAFLTNVRSLARVRKHVILKVIFMST